MDDLKAHVRCSPDVVVIGAGIAGLAATLRLATIGIKVTLLERHEHLGGKIRTVPSAAGPIDAGPTVLTMRNIFDDLFSAAGEKMEDHVDLIRQPLIARHFWPDGSHLDLFDDPDASIEAIRNFAGMAEAQAFVTFSQTARDLFESFENPMMQAAEPGLGKMTAHVLRNPNLISSVAPFSTLKSVLRGSFRDARLRQLFGRYATYVGGAPDRVPGILSLIWHAEASGVWAIDGGIHKLAHAIARLAEDRGARIETGVHVDGLSKDHSGHGYRVHVSGRADLKAPTVLYAGDPRALAEGQMGLAFNHLGGQTLKTARSFSARVHSFAATPKGLDLAHHNVLFDSDPDLEFEELVGERLPTQPSIYICAMDRGLNRPVPDLERFEIITNAPACPGTLEDPEKWHPKIIQTMGKFGLTFSPTPTHLSVTTETHFARMFPGSQGALYGQSPNGLMSSFKRPRARTRMSGFYLAGGGCHPGAGVPMAATSGRLAVEAILNDRISAFA